jgi:hypothetical protein
VFVDGKLAGQAPLEAPLPAGAQLIGAELGTLTGATRVRPLEARQVTIVMREPAVSPSANTRPWRPSWSGAALGVGLMTGGALLHTLEEPQAPSFLTLGLTLTGAFISALSIGLGED